MVANLTWIDFKELFVESFMSEYQILHMVLNLVQMRHIGPLKAYMCDLYAQVYDTLKMDEISKNASL